MPLNIEIKARCSDQEFVRQVLAELKAEHIGTDHQVDTYFNVVEGRLKLREGRIENNLIFYRRPDEEGPRISDVILYPGSKDPGLKKILEKTLGIKVVVDKIRDIYFVDNVKFHIDKVKGLGSFVEIEAIGEHGDEEKLDEQCKHFMQLLNITDDQLVSVSYSDLLLK